jgi:hypothetical protein
MSYVTIANRSQVFAAAAAIGAAGLLVTIPAPAQGSPTFPLAPPRCLNYTAAVNGPYIFHLDNGTDMSITFNGTQIAGPASYTAGYGHMEGTATGVISGDTLNGHATWNDGAYTDFQGTITDSENGVGTASGTAVGQKGRGDWIRNTWKSEFFYKCTDAPPAAPPAPAPAPKPAPIPGTPVTQTVKVTSDVDVYDIPDGDNGHNLGVLRKGSRVQVLDRQNGFAHVKGDSVPSGIGYAWGDQIPS